MRRTEMARSGDDIDDPLRDDDDFFHRRPSRARWTAVERQDRRLDRRCVGVAVDDEFRALFPVHLYRKRHSIVDDRLCVGGGQGASRDQRRVTERRPAFLRQMRHHRRKQSARECRPPRGRQSADRSSDFRVSSPPTAADKHVGEIVDLGDGDVETKPLDDIPRP